MKLPAELERQVNLLKSMELLSRARLFMYQSNFGLAEQDVQIARNVLATVQGMRPRSLPKIWRRSCSTSTWLCPICRASP